MNSTLLDLRKGLGDYLDYKAFKFPGGELHFEYKNWMSNHDHILILTDLTSSDSIILLCLAVSVLREQRNVKYIRVEIPYMPYQQADRKFSSGEAFSLKVICNILNSLEIDEFQVYDPHSDVTPALLRNCWVEDNATYITQVLQDVYRDTTAVLSPIFTANRKMVWLSPDAGAYKKIFKLAEKIGFTGQIYCCQKNRDTKTGEVQVKVPDLPNKDILIIDDICVGGRTFTQIVDNMLIPAEYGPVRRYLAVSHGVFSAGLTELAKRFTRIYTTDSRNQNYEANTSIEAGKLTVIYKWDNNKK